VTEAPPPVAPQPTPQKKGLAIASLVAGLLCCAPVGLVLGIMSLVKKDQGGKGMAIAGVVLSALGLIAYPAVLIPALLAGKGVASMGVCSVQLAKVGTMLQNGDSAGADRLVSESSGACPLVLVSHQGNPSEPGAIIAYCQGHTIGGQKMILCLLGDGSVKPLPEAEFRDALGQAP